MPDVITYGQGGYDPGKADGGIVDKRTVTDPPRNVNRALILLRAEQALSRNATYLALTAPAMAQHATQIKTLTRQVNALIRILLDDLNDVSDTDPTP